MGYYPCPVDGCTHAPFKAKQSLRKHMSIAHPTGTQHKLPMQEITITRRKIKK